MRRALAITAESICLGYFAAIEYVDLFPWNNVREGNGQERADIAAIALQLGAIGATAVGPRPVRLAAAGLYSLWLVAHAAAWWVPYLRGPTPEHDEVWHRYFAETTTVMPRLAGRDFRPDSAHLVLHVLTAAAAVGAFAVVSGSRGASVP